MPTMKTLSHFSYLSLIPLASAINPSPIGLRQWSTEGVSRQTGSSGPWNISSEDWAFIMSEPDFERVFPINGHNVSSADKMDTIDGWTITLSVRTEIPADGVIDTSDPDADFAGSLVRLNPPESLVEQAQGESNEDGTISLLDPTWRLCLGTYSLISLEERNAVAMDDGSCRSIFSDECLRAFGERRTIEAPNPYLGCSLPSFPSECSVYGSGLSGPLSGRYSTWDDDDIDWLSGSQILSVATDAWPRGDDRNDTIDRVTRYTDLVVVSWVHNATDSGNVTISSSIVCPKALNTTDNGTDSGDGGDNSGNGGGGNDSGNGDGDGDGDGDDDGNGEEEGDGGNSGASLSVSLTACVLGVLISLAL